jgi:nucleotide-binding universal stress UspA family protein
LREGGLQAHGSVVDGEPDHEILAAATKNEAVAILVGAGRKSRLDRLILGSVSSTVLRTAECSVMVVHECRGDGQVRVLAATDGTEVSHEALGVFTEIADPAQVSVTLLAVEETASDPTAITERGVELLRSARFEVTGEATTGDPATTILTRAKDFDLTVVGSRGIGTVKRALLGSVSDQLAAEARATLVGR